LFAKYFIFAVFLTSTQEGNVIYDKLTIPSLRTMPTYNLFLKINKNFVEYCNIECFKGNRRNIAKQLFSQFNLVLLKGSFRQTNTQAKNTVYPQILLYDLSCPNFFINYPFFHQSTSSASFNIQS
jgi:hypothetical protein